MKLATHPYFSSLTWNIRKMLDFGLFQKPVRCYIFIHPSRMNDEIFVRIIFGRQSLLFQKRYLIFIRKVSKLGTVKKVSAVHEFHMYGYDSLFFACIILYTILSTCNELHIICTKFRTFCHICHPRTLLVKHIKITNSYTRWVFNNLHHFSSL